MWNSQASWVSLTHSFDPSKVSRTILYINPLSVVAVSCSLWQDHCTPTVMKEYTEFEECNSKMLLSLASTSPELVLVLPPFDMSKVAVISEICYWMKVAQSCPTLCDPTNGSLPGSAVHGVFQARVLEWGAISFSRGPSQPRDRTRVSCIADRCFTVWE